MNRRHPVRLQSLLLNAVATWALVACDGRRALSPAADATIRDVAEPTIIAEPVRVVAPEPGVPRTLCEQSCANVGTILKVELASLPDGGRTLASEIETASGTLCIDRCERLGDPVSIACIMAARTVLELGACDGQAAPP